MEVRYCYRLYGAERRYQLRSYGSVTSPTMCCEEMGDWWDHIVTLGLQGRPQSSNICVLLIHRTDACNGDHVLSGVPIRNCPWCGEKIELVDEGVDTTPETPPVAQPPKVLRDPNF